MIWRQWMWATAGWMLLGCVMAGQTVAAMKAEGMRHNWSALFAMIALQWLPWAFWTPAVLWMGGKHPVRPARSWREIIGHGGLWLGIALSLAAFGALLSWVLNPWGVEKSPSYWRLFWARFSSQAHVVCLGYAGLIAAGWSLEAKQQLAEARLEALRKQLEPHLLFNTLNGIAGMVREKRNDEAVGMIAKLADILRTVLDGSGRKESSLAEEVDFVEKYLSLQKMRMGERLKVETRMGEGALTQAVPSLILQPLVENAIQHGLARRVEGGTIWIEGSKEGTELVLRVRNEGGRLQSGMEGVGLRTTRERLQTMYGGKASFRIGDGVAGGVAAEIRMPWREA